MGESRIGANGRYKDEEGAGSVNSTADDAIVRPLGLRGRVPGMRELLDTDGEPGGR